MADPNPAGAVTGTQQIEVDEALINAGQSDYESEGLNSETTSLASSIYNYKYENGRRYHSYRDGAYVLPNDESEQDRLDLIHHMYRILFHGDLTTAPVTNPQRILDVGTGTGIWAIDAADEWPSAEVRGTDLSPIQPTWVPPNCQFEIDDAEREWTFPADHFDFVHSRNLAQSIKDWPGYLAEMYKHTAPGGLVELVETEILIHSDDNSLPEDCALNEFMKVYHESLGKMGIPNPCKNLKKWAEEAGFEDVSEVKYKVPWGMWPKNKQLREIGKCVLLNIETGFEAYGLALMARYGNKTPEEAKKICENARKDSYNRNIHVWNYHYVIVGRKPKKDE